MADERRRVEEEEAKTRLKVADSSQLANKLLDHVKHHTRWGRGRIDCAWASCSYEMTPEKKPIPSSETNYGIEDLDSGDETDDDEAPRKKIPTWALGSMRFVVNCEFV
jgi:inner centromere protein